MCERAAREKYTEDKLKAIHREVLKKMAPPA
jgi:hypothetical protein